MKLTLTAALLTALLTQAGAAQLAEFAYLVTVVIGWTQGRRAITDVMVLERKRLAAKAAAETATPATSSRALHGLEGDRVQV